MNAITGSINWTFEVEQGMGDQAAASTPTVGQDGTIYFGAENGHLYAVNPDGSEKWKFNTGSAIYSAPVIGSSGVIYIGSTNGKLYAISSQTSQPADTPWPQLGRNQLNSNQALNYPPIVTIDQPSGDITTTTDTAVDFRGSVIDESPATVSYIWDFDGGAPNSEQQNPGLTTFSVAGTYTVTLTATDNEGLAEFTPPSITMIVQEMPNPKPDGKIEQPIHDVTIVAGDKINFQGSSTDGKMDSVTYLWDFDGATNNSRLQNPGFITFNVAGIFTVTLIVTDKAGSADDSPPARTITVHDTTEIFANGFETR